MRFEIFIKSKILNLKSYIGLVWLYHKKYLIVFHG